MKLRFSDGYSAAVEFEVTGYEDFAREALDALRWLRAKTRGRGVAHLHLWNGRIWYNVRDHSTGGDPRPVIVWDLNTAPSERWLDDAFEAVNHTAAALDKIDRFLGTFMGMIEDEIEDEAERQTAAALFGDMVQGMADVLTVEEVAQIYGIEAGTVRRTIHLGKLRARKAGKTLLVRRADAEARWGKNKK